MGNPEAEQGVAMHAGGRVAPEGTEPVGGAPQLGSAVAVLLLGSDVQGGEDNRFSPIGS